MKDIKLVSSNTLQIEADGTQIISSSLCPLKTHDEDLIFQYKDEDEFGTPCCMLDGNVCEHFIGTSLENGYHINCSIMKESDYITFICDPVSDRIPREEVNNYLRSRGVVSDKLIPDDVNVVKIIVTPNKLEYISEGSKNV